MNGLADEYLRGFKVMHSLACDVPLGSHPAMHNMAEKYARLGKGGPNPYIDPAGCTNEIRIEETAFLMEWDSQKNPAGNRAAPRGQ